MERVRLELVLIEEYRPAELLQRLALFLPEKEGRGREGLLRTIQDILRYSVNTWDQGFMDKLYSSTNAVSHQPFREVHRISPLGRVYTHNGSRSAWYQNCCYRC